MPRSRPCALRDLEPVPQQRFILQLYGIIGYICGQIVSKEDPAYKECARPDLTQNIPMVNVPGGAGLVLSGIGGGGGGSGSGSGSGGLAQKIETTDQKTKILQSKVDALEQQVNAQNDQQRRRWRNEIERAILGDELKAYKRALCVKGEDAATDVFDDQTREGLRLFSGGITWKAPAETAPVITPGMRQDLRKAAGFFPDCAGRAVNAYELGVYARSNTAADNIKNVDDVLSRATSRINGGQALTARPAIGKLRDHFAQQAPVPSGGTRDALDSALWLQIQTIGKAEVPAFPGSGAKK